jgi:general secretion pathway protein A
MYARYWGLEGSPFRNTLDVRRYHASAVHEEALSRLLYLVDVGRRCGLLTGPAGTGKSLLLRVVADQVRRSQRQAVLVDLTGLTGPELATRLCQGCGVYPTPTSVAYAWAALAEHFASQSPFDRHTVVLLDGLDDAGEGCRSAVERLLHLTDDVDCLTVLVATRQARLPNSASRLVERVDLRAELLPLDFDQTAAYVSDLLHKVGCDESLFEPDALLRLAEFSEGVPRRLNRLADLSLLAAMGEGLSRVSGATVYQAAAELQPHVDAATPVAVLH